LKNHNAYVNAGIIYGINFRLHIVKEIYMYSGGSCTCVTGRR